MANPTYPDGNAGPPHRPAVASTSDLAQTDGKLAYLRVNPITGALKTEVSGAGSGGTSSVDGDAFTAGASAGTAIIGEVGGSSLKIAVLNTSRDQIVQLARGSDGAEVGTVGAPIRNQQVGTSNVQIVDGSANAVTVTGNKLDVNATVSVASDGATGSAVPSSASYMGVNVGGNIVGITGVNPSGSIEAAQTDLASIAGTTAATNSGVKGAGTLRVVLATDQPALTNKLLVTPDLPSGASTAAKQPALGTAGTASTDVITIQGIAAMTKLLVTPDSVALPANQSCNAAQINGVTPLMGSGNTGTGSLRVTIATDQPALTNKLLVTPDAGSTVSQVPAASGGLSISRTLSANNTTGINAKASAGQVYGFIMTNTNAAARFVKLYNKASAPSVGSDTPVITLVIPGSATGAGMVAAEFTSGIAFGTGIGYGITTAIADNDTGAPAANEVVVNLFYK